MAFNPSDPVVDESEYELKYWTSSDFGHVQGQQVLCHNMIEPRGLGLAMRSKVDAEHSSDILTRRSRTGFLVWLKCYFIHWL